MRLVPLTPVVLLLAAACIDAPWSTAADAAPAAAESEAFPPDATLDEGLALMVAVLDSAIQTGLNDEGVRLVLRAEALSDRILETRLPFRWLGDNGYSVEARVWQIQSRADRLISSIRVGTRREDLIPELQAFRDDVEALRIAFAAGGSEPPPPIDRLLRQLDSADRR